jgi:hypothetical protein
MKDKAGSYRFVLPGAGKISGSAVLLFPFRNLAAHEFSFPFHGTSKVRDALKIQYRPLLGEGIQNVGFMPFFTRLEKKNSSGCAFIVREDEAADAEKQASGVSGDCAVWPSPLAFAGEVGPNGLIVWSDGDFTTSVWIKNWTPALYRTVSGGTSPEEEERLAVEYIERAGGVVEKTLIVESRDVSVDDMQACGARTLKLCPVYAAMDLSGRGANIQEEKERLFDAVSRASRLALASGLVFLAATLALFAKQSSIASDIASNPAAVYESAFGERSMQPVASSLTKLRSSRDGAPETVSAMLEDISSIYENVGEEGNIIVETLRYGSDGTDILGTSKNNDSIQRFRSLLEELGYAARTDNIETVPGGDMRFSMNVSRGAPK